MYVFFDFHKEKVNIFFELFYGAYRLTVLLIYRLTGLLFDCSSVRQLFCSTFSQKKSCIIVVRVIISCIFAFAILRRI